MKRILLFLLVLTVLVGCKKEKPLQKDGALTVIATFNIPASSIALNPSGNAPLSALVKYTSTMSGYTQIVVRGKNGAASDITQTFTDNGTSHAIPIAGLYPDFKNTVDIYLVYDNNISIKSTINITTGALPANVPNYIHVDTADRTNMESGLNLVSSFSGYPNPPQVPFMMDSFGDIRWCLDFTNNPQLNALFYDCGISRLQDGNFFFADRSSSKIYEVDLLGKIVNSWSLGSYIFHHNVTEKPNGNFLITVTKPGSTHTNGGPTVEDYVLELARTDGHILNTWDLKESLNEYRTTLNSDPQDWIHANAVIYDASDNTIIISGRVQGVVKLTYDNHVRWILAPHIGWGYNRRGENLNRYLLTPLDASGFPITDSTYVNGHAVHPDFEWNWYQHSPVLLPSGDLMIFDNGSIREFDANAALHYSRSVEYKIDPVKMTVQQVWEYGKERGGDTYSYVVSSVKYLPHKNHILFSPGYQVTNATGAGGKIVEVDYATKKVVFQLSVSSPNGWGWHRVQRLELYPNGNPYIE